MERKTYLDILKGMAIFLVVFAHFRIYEPLKSFIYTFHMPLFMLLAGCTFFYSSAKREMGNTKVFFTFLSRKSESLLFPYFTFMLLLKIPFYHADIKKIFTDFYVDFIALQSLWFLPVLFGIECLFSFTLFLLAKVKVSEKKHLIFEALLTIFYILFSFVLFKLTKFEIFRKISIYLIPFIIGFWVEKYSLIKRICFSEVFCITSILICMILIPHYNLTDKSFVVLFSRLLVGILISLLLYKLLLNIENICISRILVGGGKCIGLIGKHTLEIYIFSGLFTDFYEIEINTVSISCFYYFISSISLIIVCLAIGQIILYTSSILSLLILGKRKNMDLQRN